MHKPIARVEALVTHHDSRGNLTELVHCYDLPQSEMFAYEDFHNMNDKLVQVGQFGQVYVVRNEQVGTIRAFHKHERQWDYFTVVNGKAKIWVVDPEEKEAKCFILSGANMSRLIIPPLWNHGWESLVPNTILISTITDVYDRENPDEIRIPHVSFKHLGVVWGVEHK